LDHGADVNAKETLRQTTALMWAVEQNNVEVVRFLLERGADVRARSIVVEPKKRYGNSYKSKISGNTGGLSSLVLAAREGALAR
jgi:ankyrin repeat protein